MPTQTLTQCQGLVTGPNSEQAGPGALKQALNVVVKRPHLIEKRRPVRQYTQTGSFTSSATPNAMFGYNNRLYVIDNNATSRWYVDDGTNTATLSQLTPLPAGVSNVAFGQYPTAELNGNVYIPFAGQVLKIDQTGGIPYFAGLPKPLFYTNITLTTNANGWTVNAGSVAYRAVLGFIDANNTLVLSAPSNRLIFTATGVGFPHISVRWPNEVTNSAKHNSIILQIYRTQQNTSGGDPGDEMGLVFQKTLVTGDTNLTAVDDIFPESVPKGPALYSNQSQSGAAQFNYQPPLCNDVAAFKGAMFFGNTTSKHRLSLTMVGVPTDWAISSIAQAGANSTYTFSGSPDLSGVDTSMLLAVQGTVANDNIDSAVNLYPITAVNNGAKTIVCTNAAGVAAGAAGTAMAAQITVASRVYNAFYITLSAAPQGSTSNGGWGVPATGTLLQRIAGSVSGLASATAKDASATVAANAIGGVDDAPGITLMEEIGIGGSSYTATAKGTEFQTHFSPTLSSAQTSSNDAAINRVYYSKYLQPEHVPLGNYFDIGGKTKKVLRIVPLRDSLFVFKEDGVFRVTGDGSNWSVARFDDTIQLITPNALAVIYNTVYAITTKGIVAITDNGIRLLSEPISNLSRTYTDSPAAPTVYARASEKDGLVHFAITQGTSKIGLCYSYRTNTWSQDDLTAQGPGSVSLLNGPGITVAGFNYLMNTDQVYVEPTVDPTENPGLGTVITGGPVPSDRYLINITNVNGGASQITATNNAPNARAFTVGDLVLENNVGVATAGLYVITNVNGSVLTLSAVTASGAIAPSGTFAFANGKAYIFGPLSVLVEYQPFTAGDDHTTKRFPAASVLLDSTSTANQATIGFFTEIAKAEVDQISTASSVFDLRTLVPLTMNRAHRLSLIFKHSQPGQYVFIKGVSYDFTPYANTRSVE